MIDYDRYEDMCETRKLFGLSCKGCILVNTDECEHGIRMDIPEYHFTKDKECVYGEDVYAVNRAVEEWL
jgi:hypothetical protein